MGQFCSIDIETTGLNPEQDQVLEVAAVLAQYEGQDLMAMPAFWAKVYREIITGSPVALFLNVRLIKELSEIKLPLHTPDDFNLSGQWIHPDWLGGLFAGWLKQHGVTRESKVFPCGKNFQGFDRQFLYRMKGFPKELLHHRALDPGAMWAGWGEQGGYVPGLNEFPTPSGLEGKEHEALFDARKALYWSLRFMPHTTLRQRLEALG